MAEKNLYRSRGRERDLPEHFVRDPRTRMVFIRLRVPKECQPNLPHPYTGRGELLHFFGTRDKDIAIHKEREQQVIYRFKAMIEAARPKPTKWAFLPPTQGEIERMKILLEGFLTADPKRMTEEGRDLYMRIKAGETVPALEPEFRQVLIGEDEKEIIRFEAGVDLWADLRRVVGPSRDQFKARFREFQKVTGHDICNSVTTLDIINYKNKLAAEGKELKTIRNYVGNIKTVLETLIQERKIDRIDLKVKVLLKGNPRTRRKMFENPDRYAIYTAALATQDPLYRYGNLLPLFSGMRINEWAEADTRDVRRLDGVWCLCLDYDNKLMDDQTLKNNESIRKVPIHSCVLKAGLLKYVRDLPPGPLFPMLQAEPKYGRRRQDASRRMGFWLRDTAGIKDPKKVNHSHRHSAETLMLVGKVDKRLAYAVTGHAPADAGEGYIHPPIPELKEAVEKIPIPQKPTSPESIYDYAEDDAELVA